MLRILDLRERGESLEATRFEIDPTVTETVAGILQRVFVEGDDILIELAQRFDGADLSTSGVLVTDAEMETAERDTPPELRTALDGLIERLREHHARQLPQPWSTERDGVRYGEIVRPLHSVGCYVPGGRAVYPSSVCMTVVPAVVAGVEEIVLCTPPQADGSIPASVLYAAAKAGATIAAKTGGAQAVAAMAYGTESIPRVDRIVGPGNAYVTEAKRQVAGLVGIDGLAGPSELAIVAGAGAPPRLVALDLIAQAEHDPQACTFFVTTSDDLVHEVSEALEEALPRTGRRGIVDAALRRTRAVIVRDLDQAAEVVDNLAAEHLMILLPEPYAFLDRIRNAGAVFIGPATAVPFGDYGVASNHVLPTAGTARFSSGLRASDYVTVSSVVELSDAAAARFAPTTAEIALAEGLVGHAKAMRARAPETEPIESKSTP
jgi:histidinol dehydrogenase